MRIVVTLALLAVLELAALLPVLAVNSIGLEHWNGAFRFGVMALGVTPLVGSFVFIELSSFVFPITRKLRRGGSAGRAKLNALAIRFGFGFALFQAFTIAIALQNASPPGGVVFVTHPGPLFVLSTIATLSAGTALTYLLGRLISRWGLGNGFCVILLHDAVWRAFGLAYKSVPATGLSFGSVVGDLIWLAAIALLVWRFSLRQQAALIDAGQESIPVLTLPAFPQGILPVLWAYAIITFLSPLKSVLASLVWLTQSPIDLFLIAVLIVALSFGACSLFSGRGRLSRNLPHGVLPPAGGVIPLQSLILTTALLAVFGAGFPVADRYLDLRLAVFGFPGLAMAVAFGFDIVAEWRFRHRHRDHVACLLEMDNVYCAAYLHGLLAKQGFDSLIRTFHYRSLFFDFGPLVKMELLVPAAELDPARAIIKPDLIEVV
ncbi:MAG: hypothetical protein ABI693_00210 [Bryobacteraceae bacterium]